MATLILLILILNKGVLGALLSGPQEVSVVAGGTALISCHYHSFYHDYVKYWCKGYYWNHCTILIKTNEADHMKEKMQIADDKLHGTFTISMKNVGMEDSGWYWCAIKRVSKHLKVAVMLTIIAGTPYQSPIISRTSPLPSPVKVTTSFPQTSLFLPSTTNEHKQAPSSPTGLTSTGESATYEPQDLVWSVWSITRWILFLGLSLYLFCFTAYCHFRRNRPSSHMKPNASSRRSSYEVAAAQQHAQCCTQRGWKNSKGGVQFETHRKQSKKV